MTGKAHAGEASGLPFSTYNRSRCGFSCRRSSVLIRKFASFCGDLVCELRNRKDTSKLLFPVWLWFRSPHDGLAATMMRTSEPPHQARVQHDLSAFYLPDFLSSLVFILSKFCAKRYCSEPAETCIPALFFQRLCRSRRSAKRRLADGSCGKPASVDHHHRSGREGGGVACQV
jgi:hypothetical protein